MLFSHSNLEKITLSGIHSEGKTEELKKTKQNEIEKNL